MSQVPTKRVDIVCDKCNKTVDRSLQEYNHEKQVNVFTVWCHGETDRCELDDTFVYEGFTVREARAFTTKRIGHEHLEKNG